MYLGSLIEIEKCVDGLHKMVPFGTLHVKTCSILCAQERCMIEKNYKKKKKMRPLPAFVIKCHSTATNEASTL